MKTLRQRVKELEAENEQLKKYIIAFGKRCDETEYKANKSVLSMRKVDEIEEQIEILQVIQQENQKDMKRFIDALKQFDTVKEQIETLGKVRDALSKIQSALGVK